MKTSARKGLQVRVLSPPPMKQINKWWPVIEKVEVVLGILSFFGLSWAEILKNGTLVKSPFIVFALIVGVRLIYKNLRLIRPAYEDVLVRSSLDDIEKVVHKKDINRAIPSTRVLEIMLDRATKRALNWVDDAMLEELNLYLDYSKGKWLRPSLQVCFYSSLSRERGTFYEGKLSTEDFEDVVDTGTYGRQASVPFFVVNSDWASVVTKVFRSMSNKLPDEFRIQITPSQICIYYKSGVTKMIKRFYVDQTFQLKM